MRLVTIVFDAGIAPDFRYFIEIRTVMLNELFADLLIHMIFVGMDDHSIVALALVGLGG